MGVVHNAYPALFISPTFAVTSYTLVIKNGGFLDTRNLEPSIMPGTRSLS